MCRACRGFLPILQSVLHLCSDSLIFGKSCKMRGGILEKCLRRVVLDESSCREYSDVVEAGDSCCMDPDESVSASDEMHENDSQILCAMAITVQSPSAVLSSSWSLLSVATSMLDEASSRMTMLRFSRMTREMQRSWRSPREKPEPSAERTVSSPSGSFSTHSRMPTRSRTSKMAASEGRESRSRPIVRFSRIVR